MYINLITIDLCPGQGGGGVNPSGTLEISENGVYDVYSYASASVDVHPSASLSETYTTNGTKTITGEFNGGSITINVHPSTSLSETYISNGNYNITGEFNGGVITVDVPAPQFVTETLNVSANGTYNPGQGIDGYSQVVVDVPISGWDQKSVTEGVQIVNLSNSASYVNSYAFINNRYLQTVNLPNCKSVGENAFYKCYSLSQVSLPMCNYISGSAFYTCSSLTQINLPMCSNIGRGAFYSCISLTQINLPMCRYIDSAAFQSCSSLTQINLPMCSYINRGAFGYCSSLSIITIGYSSICSLVTSAALSNTQITSSTGSIYVPASLVDSYKSANNWSYFSTQIFPIE